LEKSSLYNPSRCLINDRVAKEFDDPIHNLAVYHHKIGLSIGIKKITVFCN